MGVAAKDVLWIRENRDFGCSQMVQRFEDGTEKSGSISCDESRESAVVTANELDSGEGDLRRVLDTIPALAWCARPDGSMEFLNKKWHDYTGLSPAETTDWGFQAAFQCFTVSTRTRTV